MLCLKDSLQDSLQSQMLKHQKTVFQLSTISFLVLLPWISVNNWKISPESLRFILDVEARQLVDASEPAQHWRCTRMFSRRRLRFYYIASNSWQLRSSDAIYSFSFRVIMRCGEWRTWAFFEQDWDEFLRSKIVTKQLIILLSTDTTQWILKRVVNNQSRIIFLLSKLPRRRLAEAEK